MYFVITYLSIILFMFISVYELDIPHEQGFRGLLGLLVCCHKQTDGTNGPTPAESVGKAPDRRLSVVQTTGFRV